MIDHIGLSVTDLANSTRFYGAALAPLGYKLVMSVPGAAGFGVAGKPDFWIGTRGPAHTKLHVALRAENRGLVDAFHKAALQAGGKDNGPPGLREIYHPHYYGAFVFDPDGNNIEAVCHTPTGK